MTADGVRDNRGDPTKRFWSRFMVFWFVLGVVSLISQSWWTFASAATFIAFCEMQRRKAPDKPR